MRSFILNLSIAVIWMFLSARPSVPAFAVGFLIGFVLLVVFRAVLRSDLYVRRTLGFLRFLMVFIREFVTANMKVAWTVLMHRRESLYPNFISYDVAGLSPFEILLLSYCITLTPGTTTVEVSESFERLIVHALDATEPEKVRQGIKETLEKSILAFTR